MNPVELILKKRMGNALDVNEMKYFVEGYINGDIPDYQMSSMLMAIYFQDMEVEEIQALTGVYVNSGDRIDFPKDWNTVDKHSTGGVGDKITIPLSPIVAACGARIPMISGRGLGHTGGTLDKLESIPGLRTNFEEADFRKIIDKVGFSIISQSERLVPADRLIYGLRDVTATVESLPLITASIMSKKIAEGAQNLVIDLKVGTGAFLKNMEMAERLAFLLSETGKKFGQKVTVVFTDMNSPIGRFVGNALEIKESIDYLRGEENKDLHVITKKLAMEMLILAKCCKNEEEASLAVENAISSGKALDVFAKWIEIQGGNPEVCNNTDLLPFCKYKVPIICDSDGYVSAIDSQSIGYALIDIDAGRKKVDSVLNYGSGAELFYRIGDEVRAGENIGFVYCDDKEKGKAVAHRIQKSYSVSVESTARLNRVIKVLQT